jgi:hypothetical protein
MLETQMLWLVSNMATVPSLATEAREHLEPIDVIFQPDMVGAEAIGAGAVGTL